MPLSLEERQFLQGVFYAHSRGVSVDKGAGKAHMRFVWDGHVDLPDHPDSLLTALEACFGQAAQIKVVGGGALPFGQPGFSLDVEFGSVSRAISESGLGSGYHDLHKMLQNEKFQYVCGLYDVRKVFTPTAELTIGSDRLPVVGVLPQPRPL